LGHRAIELNNGGQFKRLLDVPAEPVSQDIPVSKLLDMDTIEYCERESDSAPGVVLKKGSLEVWTPIATRLRPKIKLIVHSSAPIVVCVSKLIDSLSSFVNFHFAVYISFPNKTTDALQSHKVFQHSQHNPRYIKGSS
jgi:hypothetical protein